MLRLFSLDELTAKVGFGHGPVALDRGNGDIDNGRGFVEGETTEKAELNDLSLSSILAFEAVERPVQPLEVETLIRDGVSDRDRKGFDAAASSVSGLSAKLVDH